MSTLKQARRWKGWRLETTNAPTRIPRPGQRTTRIAPGTGVSGPRSSGESRPQPHAASPTITSRRAVIRFEVGFGRGRGLPSMTDVTRILETMEHGGSNSAEQLLPLVYEELRRLAVQRLDKNHPAIHSRRRHWFMKPTCGWWTWSRPNTGTAAATSSPRPPRRCGESWWRRHGASPG